MPRLAIAMLVLLAVLAPASAASMRELFKRVSPSVVTVRAAGREITSQGPGHFSETGSGVLISDEGQVLTAAHVVAEADSIVVELGNERVPARVVGNEGAADVALLQLARVPPGAVVAKLGDSDHVAIGDEVIIVGAP